MISVGMVGVDMSEYRGNPNFVTLPDGIEVSKEGHYDATFLGGQTL